VGWLSRWTAKGREAEALRDAESALARGDRDRAWSLALGALITRGSPDSLRTASKIARARADDRLALRIDRAADDPADGSRAAEAAVALADHGALDAGIALLERALALAPFDAVLRSELAVLLARAARPAESVSCLALHPCLADDPGALFQFAWSSLLAGDGSAARDCVPMLEPVHPELAGVVAAALAREPLAAGSGTNGSRTVRDWLFVEHGAVLLRDGAHPTGDPEDPALIAALAVALEALGAPIPRVIAAREDDDDLAGTIAASLGVEHARPARAGIPSALVVARDASSLAESREHLAQGARVITFGAVLRIDSGAAVADLVGTIARSRGPAPHGSIDPAALRSLVAAGREHVLARTPRAFVPDAPIAWPPRP